MHHSQRAASSFVRGLEIRLYTPKIKKLMFERDNLKKKVTVSKTSRSSGSTGFRTNSIRQQ